MTELIIYEYEKRNVNDCHNEMDVIGQMAADGYRLVAVSPYYKGNTFYFERPKQSQ